MGKKQTKIKPTKTKIPQTKPKPNSVGSLITTTTSFCRPCQSPCDTKAGTTFLTNAKKLSLCHWSAFPSLFNQQLDASKDPQHDWNAYKKKLNSTYSTYLLAGLEDAVQPVPLLSAAATCGSGAPLLCVRKWPRANRTLLRAPNTALYLCRAVPDSRFSCQSAGSAGWHVCREANHRLPENSAQATPSHLSQAQNKAHRRWKNHSLISKSFASTT